MALAETGTSLITWGTFVVATFAAVTAVANLVVTSRFQRHEWRRPIYAELAVAGVSLVTANLQATDELETELGRKIAHRRAERTTDVRPPRRDHTAWRRVVDTLLGSHPSIAPTLDPNAVAIRRLVRDLDRSSELMSKLSTPLNDFRRASAQVLMIGPRSVATAALILQAAVNEYSAATFQEWHHLETRLDSTAAFEFPRIVSPGEVMRAVQEFIDAAARALGGPSGRDTIDYERWKSAAPAGTETVGAE